MAGTSDPGPSAPPRPDVLAIAGRAARRALADRAGLVALSRPETWAWTALPFLVAALVAEGGLSATVVLGTLYLTMPFGLLRHGMAAVGAVRGGADEAALDDAGAEAVWLAVTVLNVPILLALAGLAGPTAAITLVAMVALCLARGLAPWPRAAGPVVDVATRAALPALAALTGIVSAGATREDVPWTAVVALGMWTLAVAAMQATPSLSGATGRRVPGALAALGVGSAILLAIATGPLGALAALGVATYLLPAAMTMRWATAEAASPPEPLAARELPALHALAGGWLIVLLLIDQGIVTIDPWEAAVLAPTIAAGYALSNIVATRIATHRHRVRPDGATPSLAIIVPRGDAPVDAPFLADLRAQTYADTTILVAADANEDPVVGEVAAWLGEDAVLPVPPPPDGWSATAWDGHVGASATDADLLLFVEPATRLAPIASRILVEQLLAGRWDLLSGAPTVAMPLPADRAAAPAIPLAVFAFVPVWWTAITGGRPATLALAHGGIVIVQREAYVAGGGHAAVRSSPHPAVALARAVARTGGRVGVVHAARLGSARRIRSLEGLVADQRRGYLSAVGGSLAGGIVGMLLTVLAFVAPPLVLPLAVLAGLGAERLAAAAVPLAVLLAARLALALTQHHPLASVAWHPITIGGLLVGQAAAIVDRVRDGADGRAAPTPTDAAPD